MHEPTARSFSFDAPPPDLLHDIGDPEAMLKRGPEHDSMAACLGSWKVEGALADSGTRMVCTENYEWLPGKFFIHYRFDRQIGAREHRGVGIIGYDNARRGHFAYFVDNMGYARMYDVHIDGRKWAFIGNFERAALTFDADKKRMAAHWEHSTDGQAWRVLCNFEGIRH